MQETGTYLSSAAKHQPAPLPYSSGPRLSGHNSNLPWLAVYTKQHHEKRVAEFLVDQRFDCYLPLYTAQRKWSNHRTATLQMPLFPTYLVVPTSPDLRIRILRTPGVIVIVGRGSSADEVSDLTIEVLRRASHLRNPKPHAFVVAVSVRNSDG